MAVQSFKDNKGREWTVTLDGPKIKDVRKLVKIGDVPVDLNDVAIFEIIDNDSVTVLDILWVLCKPQGKAFSEQCTSDTQFGEIMVGDADDASLLDVAKRALAEACIDFFRYAQRAALRTMLAKTAEARKMAIQMAMEQADDPKAAEAVQLALKERMANEFQSALTKLRSVSSSPES